MWTDSHCHVHDAPDDEADAAVTEAVASGVGRLVAVGTDVRTSHLAVALAGRHDGVAATAGVHPHDAVGGLDGLTELLDGGGVVAVGECGLDYHYDHSPRPAQREVFEVQVGEARQRGLALVVHTREAWDDTFAILEADGGAPERTVLHCFTGGPDEAKRALDAGLVLSFSGIVSFKGAADVREAAALCPLDRLLVETDSPYLAPLPHRGKQNRPAWVPLVGEAVAAAKGVPVAEVEEASTANAERIFGLGLG
jgi:TatD DNase family protein